MAEFGKLDFAVSLNPTSGFPMDARTYFTSYDEAVSAAATAEEVGSTNTKYYYGMRITVVQNGVAKHYTITPSKTLQEDGSGTGSGLPEVTEEDDGKVLKVVGGKWAAAELPVYDGSYSVTPSATDDITLQTSQKMLDADVVVSKIPYAEVSNSSNGTTVTIA